MSKFIIKNNVNGVISYKDKTISSFIIVENLDSELRLLAEKGLVNVEKYIEKEKPEVKTNKIEIKKEEKENNEEIEELDNDKESKKRRR